MKFNIRYFDSDHENSKITDETREIDLDDNLDYKQVIDTLKNFVIGEWGEDKEIGIEVYNDREEEDDNFSGLMYITIHSSDWRFDYKFRDWLREKKRRSPLDCELNISVHKKIKPIIINIPVISNIPVLPENDEGVWSKIRTIGFNSKFSEREVGIFTKAAIK